MTGVRLVIFGRQGAGKGTQCERLCNHYGATHVATGEMLRAAERLDSPLGQQAAQYIHRGELLPDEVMIGLVRERLHAPDCEQSGFILDGFPRTLVQAEALLDIVAPRGLDCIIDLEVPKELVIERLTARQRDDDTTAAIARRLELYQHQTAPLIEWFRDRGMLEVIDGVGDLDVVTSRLTASIDARRAS